MSRLMMNEGLRLFEDLLGNFTAEEERVLLEGLRKTKRNAEKCLGK